MSNHLVVDQRVDADPAQVFAAWTSAEGLAAWWWPHIADTAYEIDATVGGRYEISSDAAGIGVRGEFLEIDEPRAIRLTWCWMNDGVSEVEEQVRVAFTPLRRGTQVTLTHELAEIAGDGEDLRQGWEDVLARLAQTGAAPPP